LGEKEIFYFLKTKIRKGNEERQTVIKSPNQVQVTYTFDRKASRLCFLVGTAKYKTHEKMHKSVISSELKQVKRMRFISSPLEEYNREVT
jgi:hypothetical protein